MKRSLTLLSIAIVLLPGFGMGYAQEASDHNSLPNASITYAGRQEQMAQLLGHVADKAGFSFVMCESPEPDVTADIALDHRPLSSSLDTICKPFDYHWHAGPGDVLTFDCSYSSFRAMPPLTLGEAWGVLEDFERIAAPYRSVKGDGLRDVQAQLVGSLTLEQWKQLRARAGERGGLAYDELTPSQQHLLVDFVTAQEFDFFLRDLNEQPWLFPLKADAQSVRIVLHSPGSPLLNAYMKPTGDKLNGYLLNTRCTLNGREYEGLNLAGWKTTGRNVDVSTYREQHSRAVDIQPPTSIDHSPPLPAGRVHLRARNADLTNVVKMLREQSGVNIILDRNLRDVRLSLRLDDVALDMALQAIAAPHDWRVFQPEKGQYALMRRRPEGTDTPAGIITALTRALPPAVRRYMQFSTKPADLSDGQYQEMLVNGRWNWKLECASEEARKRCADWDLKAFLNASNLTWANLTRGQQTDVLSGRLYTMLKEARPLHRGFPGYILFPHSDLLRLGNSDPASLSLEISGRDVNGKLNGGIGLNANGALTPDKMVALRAAGVFSGK